VASKKEKFAEAVVKRFQGYKVSGTPSSGFVNLVQIKEEYFKKWFENFLVEVDKKLEDEKQEEFEEELFDRLYDFVDKNFDSVGNIFFEKTRVQDKSSVRVFEQNDDVSLFWKTQDLYYVKNDITRVSDVEFIETIDGINYTFNFDASGAEDKELNKKWYVSFSELKIDVSNRKIKFKVGLQNTEISKTKIKEFAKELKENNIKEIDEKKLKNIFNKFEKQITTDFFICKDAKEFLIERWEETFYKYVYDDVTTFDEKRVKQLKILKELAEKFIGFIATFEDELVKIWNKKKFVRNSDYIITFGKIQEKGNGEKVIKKIINASGFANQKKEWKELGTCKNWKATNHTNGKVKDEFKHLTIDTKHFPKKIKYEILSLFDDLDAELDGYLINSDNYQALNTLQNKFDGKVLCTYIDPPYNVPGTSQTVYINDFEHAPWLSLVENRISVGKKLLDPKKGVFMAAIDKQMQESFGMLLQQIFKKYDSNCVSIIHNPAGTEVTQGQTEGFSYSNELTYCLWPRKLKWANEKPLTQYNEMGINNLRKWGNDSDRNTGKDSFYPININLKNNDVTFGSPLAENKNPTLVDKNGNCELLKDGTVNIWPIDRNGVQKKWRQGQDYIKKGIKKLKQLPDTLEVVTDLSDIAVRSKENPDGSTELMNGDRDGNRWKNYYNYRFVLKDKDGKFTEDPSKITRIEIKEIRWYGKFKMVWYGKRYNADTSGSGILREMFGKPIKEIFDNPKSIFNVFDFLFSVVGDELEPGQKDAFVLDYFGGSGTTAHATMMLNNFDGGSRKFILIEQGDYFDTVVLPRVKKASFSVEPRSWKDGKPEEDAQGIGIFVKYYKLEQYEDVLKNCKLYSKKDVPEFSKPEDYTKYIFKDDPKLLSDVKTDQIVKENDIEKIYPEIDIGETISCLSGKMIKKIEKKKITFDDDSEVDLDKINFEEIREVVWW
tara:strand:+ start:46 stop:2883 length:2838 start_codon:yes stop_codon:yes gene_type:complete